MHLRPFLSLAVLVPLAAAGLVVPCLPAADEPPTGVVVTLKGHKEAVYGVAFSPDGKFLVTASGDPSLKVWQLPGGKEVKTFAGVNGHKQLVLGVAVSPDGTQFASAGSDNTARIWDFPSSKHLREYLTADQPRAVAVSPDGKRLAGGSKDGKVRVFNAEDGKQLYEVAAHKGAVAGLAFNANGTLLVSAGVDGTLHYFNAADGKSLTRFGAHPDAITGLAYSPNSNLVFTSGKDNTLRYWSAPPTASRSLTAPFKEPLTAMTLSPDGAQVIAAAGKLVRVAAVTTGQTTRDLAEAPGPVSSVAASSGSALVAGASGRRVLVWQTKDGKLIGDTAAHTGAVTGLAFNPAGTQLITAGKDGKVRLWAMPPVPARSLGQADVVRSAVLSGDGKHLVVGGADKVVRLYRLDNLKMPQRQFSGHSAAVNCVAVSADAKMVVSAGEGGVIRFWNPAKGDQSAAIGAHTGPVHSLVLVGTTQVLSASADGTVKMWQVPPPAGKNSFSHAGAVTSAVLSPDGARVLTGCADKQVRLWNLTTGQVERTWTGPALAVQCVAFSPKGDRVAAGSADKAVHVWEATTNKEVKKFTGLPAAVQSVALSADGKHAAAGLADGSVRILDLTTGKEVNAITGQKGAIEAVTFTVKGDQVVFGGGDGIVTVQGLTAKAAATTWKHGSAIRALVLSRDGLRLAAGGAGKEVKVYTLASGKEESAVATPAEVRGLGFGPQGKRIVAAGDDGKARIYSLDGKLHEYVSHEAAVSAAAITSDGKRVVTASADKTARVSPLLLIWQGKHDSAARQAVINGRGDRVVSAGDDGLVRMWNLADGKPVQSIRAHKGAVAGLAVTADSARILTAGADKTARVWDWAKMPATKTAGKEMDRAALELSLPGEAQAVAVSPNGQRAVVSVAGAKEGGDRVHVFDTASGKELQVLGDLEPLPGRVLSFLADNRTLLAAGDKAVNLVDVNIVTTLDAHEGGVAGVAFHSNGTQVLTGGADKAVKLWTVATGKLDRTFGPLGEEVSAVGFSRDFTNVAATAGKALKVWTTADGKELHSIALPGAGRALSFNSDRSRVATAGDDGKALVWDLATRREAQSFLHDGAVVGVAFHPSTPALFVSAGADRQVGIHTLSLSRLVVLEAAPSGLAVQPALQHVLTAGADGKVGFHNLNTGARDRAVEGADKGVTCVAVSRNSQLVAAGGVDKKVRLFNYADGKMLAAFTAPAVPRALAFSPTNQALVAAGADGSLTTYDTVYNPGQPVPAEFGKVLQRSAHGKEALEVVFPSAGAIFYTAGDDNGVKAWKLASDAPVRTFNHPNTVNALAYNKAGTQLVTGCGDGRLRLFDLAKGTQLREIIAHNTPNQTAIYCVAFSPDDKLVISGSMDQSLKLFNVADGKLVREFKAYKEKVFDKGHQEAVLAVAFSPDGKQIASGSMDKTIKVWNVADGSVVRELANPNYKPAGVGLPHPSHPGWVYGLRWLADGKRLMSVGQAPRLHGYLGLWDAGSGKLLWGKEMNVGSIFSLAVAPDEKFLAVGTGGSVRSGEELNQALVLKMPGEKDEKEK